MIKFHKMLRLLILAVPFALLSCNTFTDNDDPYDVSEPLKDVSGTWKVMSVSRNNIDITSDMDFSQFAIHLEESGSYHIDNYLPFIVSKDGTWKVDDPRYPLKLIFTENGQSDSTEIEINYPITNGKRSLTIEFSPVESCNMYKYSLSRDTNQ